jgi:hypothetical protein
MPLANSPERTTEDERIAEFREWIGERRGEAVFGWANATEEDKLRDIYWESTSVSGGLTVPGAAVLEAIEESVDVAGLTAVQREMLRDIRARLDAGGFDASPTEWNDRIKAAVERVVDTGLFKESLRSAKASTDRPWAEVPGDLKVGRIIEMARDSGVWTDWSEDMAGTTPGAHLLETIDREVDYAQLSPWRREGLERLGARFYSGELADENADPSGRSDLVARDLRMAELEARIEDFKHLDDDGPDPGRYRRWGGMAEEAKLNEILHQMRTLGLESEPAAYVVAAREVDVKQLPREARREFNDRQFDAAAANLRQQW